MAYWCEGNPYYEQAGSGDGLLSKYFSNEAYLGETIESKVTLLNFNWMGGPPAKNIDPNNFSLILTGYITPPLTDEYEFVINADAASLIRINGKVILDHFMSERKKGWKDFRWGDRVVSNEIKMNAGTLYELEIRYRR